MKKILVTGISGFIGQNLSKELIKLNWSVRGTVRKLDSLSVKQHNLEFFPIDNIDGKTNWNKALENIDYVIHCAGKAHEMNKDKNLNYYQSINTNGTIRLAEHSAKAGVKRLIFLSSIKVYGESSNKFDSDKKVTQNKIFKHDDLPDPKDFYALSKLKAEKALWEISNKTDLEVVVLRLPLVYGQGVKGNLMRLIKLIKYGIPLPFSLIRNQRSLIGIDNLVDVLVSCVENLDAKGKTFLVSDNEDLSTPDLLSYMMSSLGRSSRLFPFPISLLRFISRIIGKNNEMERLVGSLQVDIDYTRKILNWTPPVSVKEGIRRMVSKI
tara:strand:- start:6773 stop:7744 length:972 start_codon:yes stop_codon:yes gene_type:complete